jgi:hypothetical protein
MELALHLGMTTQALTSSMLESELNQWGKYAERYPLPYKRMELMLAQVCAVVARTGGAKNITTKDFMLSIPEDLPQNISRIEMAREAFGFNPRKKKA